MVRGWAVRLGIFFVVQTLWLAALFHGILSRPQWTPYLNTHLPALVAYSIASQAIVEAVPVLSAWVLLVRPDHLSHPPSPLSPTPALVLWAGIPLALSLVAIGILQGVPQHEGWVVWGTTGCTALLVALGEEFTARFAVWGAAARHLGLWQGAVTATVYFLGTHIWELLRNVQAYPDHAFWGAVGDPAIGLLAFSLMALWMVWRSGSLVPAIVSHWARDWLPWHRNFMPIHIFSSTAITIVVGIALAEALHGMQLWRREY